MNCLISYRNWAGCLHRLFLRVVTVKRMLPDSKLIRHLVKCCHVNSSKQYIIVFTHCIGNFAVILKCLCLDTDVRKLLPVLYFSGNRKLTTQGIKLRLLQAELAEIREWTGVMKIEFTHHMVS